MLIGHFIKLNFFKNNIRRSEILKVRVYKNNIKKKQLKFDY